MRNPYCPGCGTLLGERETYCSDACLEKVHVHTHREARETLGGPPLSDCGLGAFAPKVPYFERGDARYLARLLMRTNPHYRGSFDRALEGVYQTIHLCLNGENVDGYQWSECGGVVAIRWKDSLRIRLFASNSCMTEHQNEENDYDKIDARTLEVICPENEPHLP